VGQSQWLCAVWVLGAEDQRRPSPGSVLVVHEVTRRQARAFE
jgi:hypothetical protein